MRRVTRRIVTDLRTEQRTLVAAMQASDFAGPDVDRIHDDLVVIEDKLTALIRS